ncbi:hypothetical protein D3C75_1288310 [compost metagenome]
MILDCKGVENRRLATGRKPTIGSDFASHKVVTWTHRGDATWSLRLAIPLKHDRAEHLDSLL